MALETIVRCPLETGSFELEWENSGDFLHLVCHHPNLSQPLGISLDARERQNFLHIVRQAQKLQTQPPEYPVRIGSLPPRPVRLRFAMLPGPKLQLEAVSAGRQLFEVQLNPNSTLRALIHLLLEPPEASCVQLQATLEETSSEGVRLGSNDSGTWNPLFSHVVGPEGEWLPLEELKPPLQVRAWRNATGEWERISLERSLRLAEAQRLASEGLFLEAETAFEGVPQDAATALGQAYLVVQRGPLLEAEPFLQKARTLSPHLSEGEENLLLELETYLLCQEGPSQLTRIAQNMQRLVARQITRDPWAARRALSNWRVFLDLLFEGEVPPLPLQIWNGWLAQLPRPIQIPTLSFARPAQPATQLASAPARPAPTLPPERSLAAPLIAIALAFLLGMWWRWQHPVQWGPALTPTATPQRL